MAMKIALSHLSWVVQLKGTVWYYWKSGNKASGNRDLVCFFFNPRWEANEWWVLSMFSTVISVHWVCSEYLSPPCAQLNVCGRTSDNGPALSAPFWEEVSFRLPQMLFCCPLFSNDTGILIFKFTFLAKQMLLLLSIICICFVSFVVLTSFHFLTWWSGWTVM